MIRKMRLISKNMASQPGRKTITIHIFLNISRRKGNQIMKLGRVIEHNTRKFFVENKSFRK